MDVHKHLPERINETFSLLIYLRFPDIQITYIPCIPINKYAYSVHIIDKKLGQYILGGYCEIYCDNIYHNRFTYIAASTYCLY